MAAFDEIIRTLNAVTTIGALTLPTYRIRVAGIPLLGHQVAVQQRWDSLGEVLVAAGTGTGKTLAVFLPALLRGESVIAVYPTNALLLDQAESIAGLATQAGKEARVIRAGDNSIQPDRGVVEIIPVSGPTLEITQRAMGLKRKGEALDALLTISSRPKIIVTNPDVLYLMAAMCYRDSQSALTRLSRYSTLVLDEFHLYTGVELARFLYLTHLLRFFGGQVSQGLRRVALLSATSSAETLSLLREVLPMLVEITPEVAVAAARAGVHTAVYPLSFSADLTTTEESDLNEDNSGLIRRIVGFLNEKGEFLRSERRRASRRTVPALVFLNSVVEAKRLERALLFSGWSERELGSVRGLMSQQERSWEDKTVVVATAAAEVGIDFDCRLLLFEATDRGSFTQRLGRAGRHAPAEAYLIGRPGAPGIFGLRNELERRPAELTRQDFLDLAGLVFPAGDAKIDFVTSKEGVFAAASLTSYILHRVSSDYGADSIVRDRVRQTLLSMEKSYFLQWQSRRGESVSDVANIHFQVRRDMDRAAQGRSAASGWMKIYLGNFPSFRSQALQVTVFDQEEESRTREAVYRADLRTLARWAQLGANHRFESDLGYVVDVVKYNDRPHRYCVVLHRPSSWPSQSPWPPEGLFWVGREEDAQATVVKATLISDATGGRFPGPFPPYRDLVLALVITREQLALLDFDWRLQSWPLRGQAGTASDVQPRIILLGDACLLANSRLRRVHGGNA